MSFFNNCFGAKKNHFVLSYAYMHFHITYTATAYNYVDVSVYLFTITNGVELCRCELNFDSHVSSSSKIIQMRPFKS